jgi:DNA-binding beta-propeller fold protein YncE
MIKRLDSRRGILRNPFLVQAAILFLQIVAMPLPAVAQTPANEYYVYVVCESADRIAEVKFGPKGISVEKVFETGSMPSDIDGPHGIAVSPDKEFFYVSLGHGRPFGSVWKYSTKDNGVLAKTTLGFFPATMDISKDGGLLYVVNFNLHGDMVPSSVSVVATEQMIEVARIPTCIMPHGSRINPQGTKQYSACMMDDMLVEIDTNSLKVSRHLFVAKGKEKGMTGSPAAHSTTGAAPAGPNPHAMGASTATTVSCSPTWAQPSADGKFVYIACNKSDEIVEVDATDWKLTRRIPARPGVYNLAVTQNGKLIATNKRDQSLSVYDLKSGNELARIPTRRKVLHGVVVSPDDRYAFVSVEGIGSEPGTLEVIDLESLKTVVSVDLPEQAAGIAFFKMKSVTQ